MTPDLTAIQVMEPTSAPPFSRPGWVFEFKYDGYRVLAARDRLLSRNGKDATDWYPGILRALANLRGEFVIDGEVCMLDDRGVPDFERMRGARAGVTYFAFDLLFAGGRDLRGLPLLERKARLLKLLPADNPVVRYVNYLETQGATMFEHAVKMGIEGVVGKRADSPYKGGKTRAWLKSKPAGVHDGWKRRKRAS